MEDAITDEWIPAKQRNKSRMHWRWSGGGEPPMLKLAKNVVIWSKDTDSERV